MTVKQSDRRQLQNGLFNHYKVSTKQWKKWSALAKRTFNGVMSSVIHQKLYNSAPDAPILSKRHWEVLKWNMAFEAACAVMTAEHDEFNLRRKPEKGRR